MNNPYPVISTELTGTILRSSQIQTDIFCLRERDLLRRFIEEVLAHIKQGKNKEYAFVTAYQLAENLGRAFADKAILFISIEAEVNVPVGPLKDVLALLRTLYALIILEEDSSFLRYGYLSVENATVVRQEVMKLCTELCPHALSLVSSFGIPDEFLSPIAFDWIDANSWSSNLL